MGQDTEDAYARGASPLMKKLYERGLTPETPPMTAASGLPLSVDPQQNGTGWMARGMALGLGLLRGIDQGGYQSIGQAREALPQKNCSGPLGGMAFASRELEHLQKQAARIAELEAEVRDLAHYKIAHLSLVQQLQDRANVIMQFDITGSCIPSYDIDKDGKLTLKEEGLASSIANAKDRLAMSQNSSEPLVGHADGFAIVRRTRDGILGVGYVRLSSPGVAINIRADDIFPSYQEALTVLTEMASSADTPTRARDLWEIVTIRDGKIVPNPEAKPMPSKALGPTRQDIGLRLP